MVASPRPLPSRKNFPVWHAGFLRMVPIIALHARIVFRGLRPDAKEEAVAECIANALVAYCRLCELGKQAIIYPGVLARFAARQGPLRFHIEPPANKASHRLRPPMSPGIGHRAMLLGSGHIDGLINPPDEPPHVIRGTAAKEEYVASCESSEDDDSNLTTRTVISERPRLLIRALDAEGTITNLE